MIKSNIYYFYNKEQNTMTSNPVICFDKLYVATVLVDSGIGLVYNLRDGKVAFRTQQTTEAKVKAELRKSLISLGAVFNDIVRIT